MYVCMYRQDFRILKIRKIVGFGAAERVEDEMKTSSRIGLDRRLVQSSESLKGLNVIISHTTFAFGT